jgi:hypothetical protein
MCRRQSLRLQDRVADKRVPFFSPFNWLSMNHLAKLLTDLSLLPETA